MKSSVPLRVHSSFGNYKRLLEMFGSIDYCIRRFFLVDFQMLWISRSEESICAVGTWIGWVIVDEHNLVMENLPYREKDRIHPVRRIFPSWRRIRHHLLGDFSVNGGVWEIRLEGYSVKFISKGSSELAELYLDTERLTYKCKPVISNSVSHELDHVHEDCRAALYRHL